jgi:multicopper oxidase
MAWWSAACAWSRGGLTMPETGFQDVVGGMVALVVGFVLLAFSVVRGTPGPEATGAPGSARRMWVDRVAFGVSLVLLVVGGLGLVLGLLRVGVPAPAVLQPPANHATPPPWQAQATGGVKEFQLTVGRTQWEIAPGKTVDTYAYNGQVPGPELRVTEGDTARVTVNNELQEPTTVHWHGVEVPVGMDGVPNLSQEPIAPGGTFTYEFVATPAGTRWYHAHVDEMAQQGGGLVGPLIIQPREPSPTAAPDREYTLVTGEWVIGATAASGALPVPTPATSRGTSGMMGAGGRGGMLGGGMGGMLGQGSGSGAGGTTSAGMGRPAFDTFTTNGKAYAAAAPLLVRQGEHVRLRLINAGATDTQIFALAGHRLMLTHTDGNPLQQPIEVETVPLGVGERADVEFVADNPGRWKLEAFMPALSDHGQVVDLTDVVYAGHEADTAQDFPADARVRVARYADFGGPPHPDPPDRVYELTLSGGMMMGMGSETTWTINGKQYPNTDQLDVRQGERVRLKLFNMSMEDHPMHLHGHTFSWWRSAAGPWMGP